MPSEIGGTAYSGVTEAVLGIPLTAHILGGAVIGEGPESGVVDARHRVFGYENLLVCDGAAVPANVGANPSLTITALAERAMGFVATDKSVSHEEGGMQVRYRKLGSSDLEVSEISLGAWLTYAGGIEFEQTRGMHRGGVRRRHQLLRHRQRLRARRGRDGMGRDPLQAPAASPTSSPPR